MTSCDDIGSIALGFKPSEDADSEPSQVGYRIRLVRGNLPHELVLPSGPVVAVEEEGTGRGTIWVHWVDGATDDQESIDFSVTLTPIDKDGNLGPTSDAIAIENDTSGGCVLARHARAGSRLIIDGGVLFGVALLLRRWRRPLRA